MAAPRDKGSCGHCVGRRCQQPAGSGSARLGSLTVPSLCECPWLPSLARGCAAASGGSAAASSPSPGVACRTQHAALNRETCVVQAGTHCGGFWRPADLLVGLGKPHATWRRGTRASWPLPHPEVGLGPTCRHFLRTRTHRSLVCFPERRVTADSAEGGESFSGCPARCPAFRGSGAAGRGGAGPALPRGLGRAPRCPV